MYCFRILLITQFIELQSAMNYSIKVGKRKRKRVLKGKLKILYNPKYIKEVIVF